MTRQSQRKFKKRAQLWRYLAGSALDAGTTRRPVDGYELAAVLEGKAGQTLPMN